MRRRLMANIHLNGNAICYQCTQCATVRLAFCYHNREYLMCHHCGPGWEYHYRLEPFAAAVWQAKNA
jgi:hypothetical protein